MLFWIVVIALTLVCGSFLAAPLLRRQTTAPETTRNDMAIYRDQLAEVERDLARGVLSEDEAERTRTEVSRRLLAADSANVDLVGTAPKPAALFGTFMLFSLLIVGAAAGYFALGAPGYPDVPRYERLAASEDIRANRPSQSEAEAMAPVVPIPEASAEYLETVDQLRQLMPSRPDELEGWRLLARHEAGLGQYAAAARAQSQVVRIKGDAATVPDIVALVDLMVGAADGRVSPETETILNNLIERDPANIPARYYIGLLFAQTDRADIAYRIWRSVIEEGQMGTFHIDLARAQIEDAAYLAGVDYELPDVTGPTAAQVADAAALSDEDRQAMIEGMVQQLSDRLANEGGPAQDWAQLIVALGVLGNTERAQMIWEESQTVFAEDPLAIELLATAAQQAGIAP